MQPLLKLSRYYRTEGYIKLTVGPDKVSVTITFLCLYSFRFLDFAAICFASYVSFSSVLDLRIKTHANLL